MVLVYQAADDEIPHPPSDADVFKQLPELSPHFHEIVWNGALVYQKKLFFYGGSRAEVVCVDAFTGVVRAYVRRASFFSSRFVRVCVEVGPGLHSRTYLTLATLYIHRSGTYLPTSFGQMKPRVGKQSCMRKRRRKVHR